MTEAGEGEDGRIKSAIGIGSLLCDGLGDTIRVSLTEDSPREIEVCRDLLAQIPNLTVWQSCRSAFESGTRSSALLPNDFSFDPFHFERRETPEIELNDSVKCGGEQLIRVVVTRATWDKVAPKIRPKDDVKPEAIYEDLNLAEIDPTQDFEINCETQLVTVKDGVKLPAITAFRLLAAKLKRLGRNNPDFAERLHQCIPVRAPRPRRSPHRIGSRRRSRVRGFRLTQDCPAPRVGRHRRAAGGRDWRRDSRSRRSGRRPIAAAGLQHFAGGGLPFSSRPITSRARRAGGRCSISRP